jgi:hypothetical protein
MLWRVLNESCLVCRCNEDHIVRRDLWYFSGVIIGYIHLNFIIFCYIENRFYEIVLLQFQVYFRIREIRNHVYLFFWLFDHQDSWYLDFIDFFEIILFLCEYYQSFHSWNRQDVWLLHKLQHIYHLYYLIILIL